MLYAKAAWPEQRYSNFLVEICFDDSNSVDTYFVRSHIKIKKIRILALNIVTDWVLKCRLRDTKFIDNDGKVDTIVGNDT